MSDELKAAKDAVARMDEAEAVMEAAVSAWHKDSHSVVAEEAYFAAREHYDFTENEATEACIAYVRTLDADPIEASLQAAGVGEFVLVPRALLVSVLRHPSWVDNADKIRALLAAAPMPPAAPGEGKAVAWLYTLTGKSGEVANTKAVTFEYPEDRSPFGRAGIDYHAEGIVTSRPLYTSPPPAQLSEEEEMALKEYDRAVRRGEHIPDYVFTLCAALRRVTGEAK